MQNLNYSFEPATNRFLLRFWYNLFCALGNLGRRFKHKVVRLADIKSGELIVDLGCGTGVLIEEIFQFNSEVKVVGIEPEITMLNIARKKLQRYGSKVQLLQELGENTSLQQDSVDVVIMTLVLHHVPTQVKIQILVQIYRILKPGGRFMIADFGAGGISLLPFENKEYLKDHRLGLIPFLIRQVGFKNIQTLNRHSRKVYIWRGIK